MTEQKRKVGRQYYNAQGFDKAVVIHMSASTYNKLKALADKDERSLQTFIRRHLETLTK
jgi:predicted DNA-binding protein